MLMQGITGDFSGILLNISENLSEKKRKDYIHLFKNLKNFWVFDGFFGTVSSCGRL